jgi:N-carbamoylputrescine amidase
MTRYRLERACYREDGPSHARPESGNVLPMPLSIALITDVFCTPDAEGRLCSRLLEAKRLGADLALLPEIPLNPWSPASPDPNDEDAEPPGGGRHRMAAAAAKELGIGLVAGAIVRDPVTGRRHNTALAFDAHGSLVGSYAKVHLPDEPGFHEPAHYEPGELPAVPIHGFGLPIGIQICSDINRPAAAHALAASGAVAILHPRATERATYERWKLVLRSTAITTSAYVLSVNRPGPELGVPIGGPSLAIDPNGEVIVETTDAVVVVTIDEAVLTQARQRYPGYLRTNAALYAQAWSAAGVRA